MAVNLSPVGGVAAQFFDNNGVILSGGKIYTYAAGTTTNQATYTSSSGFTSHSNPIILDSAGRVPSGEIWLTDGLQYKFVVKNANDVTTGTYDNIIGINSNFVSFTASDEIQTATAGQTVFTLTTMQYTPGANNLTVFVDGVNQYDGSSYAYVETNSTTVTFTAGLHVGALVKFTTAQSISTTATDAVNVGYTPAGTGAVPTNVQAKLRQTVSVQDFGAVGDGVTDDTAAIQLAVDHLNTVSATAPASLVFPSGRYLITDEIDLTATGGERREIIGGTGFETAELLVNFSGYDKYVFKLGDPDAPAYQTAISITGFQFTKVTSAHQSPVGIGGNGIAQSRISNVVFGSWNNTTIQLYAPQNCRFENITTFGGGHSWDYKSTTGITVLQSGTTLTASASLFSAADVGHTVNLWGGSPNFTRRKAVITGYTSATQVTVNTSYTDVTALSIYFGSPFASMTSGSATLTADASCFTSTDVGIVIYVKGAGASGRMLRSRIATYVSATQVTLDDAAGTTVTTSEFATPVLDIHSVGASSGAGGSDNSFYALQLESHQGIAIGAINLDQLSFDATKLHGEQTIAANQYALAPMWTEQVSGYYQGSFDAQYLGSELVAAVYQTSVFNFESLLCRTAQDGIFLRVGARASGFEGGLIQLDDVAFLGTASTLVNYNSLVVDSNTPAGYVLSGKMSTSAADLTKVYLGNGVYGTPAKGMAADETAGTFDIYRNGDGGTVGSSNVIASTITWDGTPPSGTSSLRYTWQRVGNVVQFWMRLKYSVAGATNSSLVIALPSDMPAPYYLEDKTSPIAASELIGTVSGGLATSATAVYELPKGFLRRNSAGTGFEVSVQNNSGTISALVGYVQGSYFTA